MPKRTCTYEYSANSPHKGSCQRTYYAHGLCGPHYQVRNKPAKMDQVNPTPRPYQRRTRKEERVVVSDLRERLEKVARVVKVPRVELERRILSDWLENLR
jgi:hypothetical protein